MARRAAYLAELASAHSAPVGDQAVMAQQANRVIAALQEQVDELKVQHPGAGQHRPPVQLVPVGGSPA
jgi:hypothetical protein